MEQETILEVIKAKLSQNSMQNRSLHMQGGEGTSGKYKKPMLTLSTAWKPEVKHKAWKQQEGKNTGVPSQSVLPSEDMQARRASVKLWKKTYIQ